jgi:hypothetical protein
MNRAIPVLFWAASASGNSGFSSHIFVFYFLPFVLAVYYALARAPQRWRNLWLILTGYTLYGGRNPDSCH